MTKGEPDMNGRDLDAAHARIDSIERNVEALAESVKDFASETRHAMTGLSEKISKSQQTDWRIVASFAALVLTLIGGSWALITRQTESTSLILSERLHGLEAEVQHEQDSMTRHEAMSGHPSAMERHATQDANIISLTRRLERLERLEESRE